MTTEDGVKPQGTRVVQVTNIAITAALDQLKTFFELLGEVEEIKLYPSEDITGYSSKVCYVKYTEESSVHIAQHLTNTVFIDKALIVVPLGDGIIPEEHQALQLAITPSSSAGSYGKFIPAIPGIVQSVIGSENPVVRMLNVVPQPPALPDIEPAKIDEIRRTVLITRLPKDITVEQLMSFFFACGEIRYVRIVSEEGANNSYAFLEFNESSSVARALHYNGSFFGGIPLKVVYSKHAIVKPEKELARARKLDKTMRRVTEASRLVSEELDDDKPRSRKGSQSRSPSRRRSRSRSPRRKSRSRSADRYRRRRSNSPRYRDKGRQRSGSRSKSPYRRNSRRSRSPSNRRRKSRSPSRDRKRRRSPSPKRSRDDSRRRSRSRDRKDKTKNSSRRKSDRKDEAKSPEEKKREEPSKDREENKDEASKKKDEKPARARSRSRSKSRDKKRTRDKSGSRSTSRSPRRSSSKHKRKKERRDKSSRASDDEYDKKIKKESDHEKEKGYGSDDSGNDKKSHRRRGDDATGRTNSDDESKRKKRHKKKVADQYDSGSD